MDSTTYSVVLRLSTEGSLAPALQQVGDRANKVDSHLRGASHSSRMFGEMLSHAGERAGHALEGAADKAMEVSTHLAKWGVAAGVGLATYGVVHLNQELENTTISLAAIAQAQGFSSTFAQGWTLATDQIAKMKQDVKTLPGDLGQLSDIMKMIATPAAAGGASMDQIRGLAGRTMLTSTILGVQQDVAAREMAGLLAGRAGSHNILGGRLGLIGEEAKSFNALSPEARLAKINAEMDKYKGAADAFGSSFVAQWTTLKDNIKYTLLAPVTSPLFEHVKHSLVEINAYFDEHKQQIDAIVYKVGDQLTQAWDKAESTFKKIEPTLGKIVGLMADLNQPQAMKHLEHAGEAMLAMKAAGMGLSGASGMAGSALRFLPMLGEGGAAAGGAGAGLGATIATGGVALAALAADAVVAGGAVDVLTDSTNRFHDTAMVSAMHVESEVSKAFTQLKEDAAPVADSLRSVADALGVGMIKAADFFVSDAEQWIQQFTNVSSAVIRLAERLGMIAPQLLADETLKIGNERELPPGLGMLRMAPNEAFGGEDKRPKGPTGAGNTYIQKVEINVSSNADPSRVARLAAVEVDRLNRNPKSSRHVPRWDSSQSGS